MNYGIANRNGKPELDLAIEIVRTAWENGITFFDTAQAYGNSEEVLGLCFRELGFCNGKDTPAVISKLSPDIPLADSDGILRSIDESLAKLGLDGLWALMLHKEAVFEKGKEYLGRVASELKQKKRIQKFGVSLYSPEKAVEALNMDEIDLLQVPFNVLDQRASHYGIFRLAREKNKKVFVRSIYLQGLLLLDIENLPDKMSFSRDALKKYNDFAKSYKISSKLLALAFVVQKADGAMIVIGSEHPDQVRENIALLERAKDVLLPESVPLSSNDLKLIHPYLWPH